MLYYIQRSNLQWIIQLALLPLVLGGMLNPTDTITWGGDNTRTGYQSTHKMDPDVVGSPSFGQIFKTLLPGFYQSTLEQIFSQPLVYTLDDGIQYVFIATTQNNIYKLNAETGAIVASRNLHVPFLTADLDGCVDINPLVGVTVSLCTYGRAFLLADLYSGDWRDRSYDRYLVSYRQDIRRSNRPG